VTSAAFARSRALRRLLFALLLALGCEEADLDASSRRPRESLRPSHRASLPPDRREIEAFRYGVLREMNHARTRPVEYAAFLREWEDHFDGNALRRPGLPIMITAEGVAAVIEAEAFLQTVRAVPALALSHGVSRAAADHVDDQGPRGTVGHVGSDGSQPWDRVSRYGEWSGSLGENILYGRETPRNVVISLIVDDGIRDRGHRQNLFDPGFRVVGVAWGGHAAYDSMAVMTFTAGFKEQPPGGE
jgi:hypothetical protein